MKRFLACPLMCGLLLVACAMPIKPTPVFLVQSRFCALDVQGTQLLTEGNRPVAFFGANLDSITAMEKAGQDPAAHARELAQAGARMVRLPLVEGEFTPTFPALKLAPFIKTANELGMVVILANDATLQSYNNDQYDSAEEWLRNVGKYFGDNPGVWFEPIERIQSISPLRRKNVWQRLADITRGYRYVNVLLVTEPLFLNEADPELQRGVLGANVVYAPRPGELRPEVLARVPHVFFGWEGASPGSAIGALTPADSAQFAPFWRTSRACP